MMVSPWPNFAIVIVIAVEMLTFYVPSVSHRDMAKDASDEATDYMYDEVAVLK